MSGSKQYSSESLQHPPEILPKKVLARKWTGPRNVKRPSKIAPENVEGPPEKVAENVQPRTWIGPRNIQKQTGITPANVRGSANIEAESHRRPSRIGADLRIQVDALIATWCNSNSGQIHLKHCKLEKPVRAVIVNQEVGKRENLEKVTSWLEFDPTVKTPRRESHNNSLQQTLHLPDEAYAHIHDTPGKNVRTLSRFTPHQIQVESSCLCRRPSQCCRVLWRRTDWPSISGGRRGRSTRAQRCGEVAPSTNLAKTLPMCWPGVWTLLASSKGLGSR